MATSTHLALVFKMLVEQKKINVKSFPSKEVVKSKTVPWRTWYILFSCYSIWQFSNLKDLYSSKNVLG